MISPLVHLPSAREEILYLQFSLISLDKGSQIKKPPPVHRGCHISPLSPNVRRVTGGPKGRKLREIIIPCCCCYDFQFNVWILLLKILEDLFLPLIFCRSCPFKVNPQCDLPLFRSKDAP